MPNNNNNPIQKLEYWTQQQQENSKISAAADKERNVLLERLSQLKARTAKIRQAVSQAKDALGKYHDIFRHLQVKKKQLEQQLDKDRLLLESCVQTTQDRNAQVSAFSKQAADSYKAMNAEYISVLESQDQNLLVSFLVDAVEVPKLEEYADGPEWEALQAAWTERANVTATREALMEKVEACRFRALQSNDPSITEESLLDLEARWANPNESDENDGSTVHMQMFYGQDDGEEGAHENA